MRRITLVVRPLLLQQHTYNSARILTDIPLPPCLEALTISVYDLEQLELIGLCDGAARFRLHTPRESIEHVYFPPTLRTLVLISGSYTVMTTQAHWDSPKRLILESTQTTAQ